MVILDERLDRNHQVSLTKPLPSPPRPSLPNMSYGKKDEDADLGLVKVDRTQVFQEGPSRAIALLFPPHRPS